MRFYRNLYTGKKAQKNIRKIRHNIGRGKLQNGIYVICLSAGEDLLDIMPSYMLFADRYKETEILGVAASKKEALDVGAKIITDVYEKTGGFDVKAYFDR